MRISDAAHATGTSPRQLRYYEQCGLIAPARGGGGYRDYSDADLERVRVIASLLATGMSTAHIRVALPCFAWDDGPVSLCETSQRIVAEEIERLSAAIQSLERARTALQRSLSAQVGKGEKAEGRETGAKVERREPGALGEKAAKAE